MRVLRGPYREWDLGGMDTAVAIGVFDGVHRGHAELLRRLGEAGGEVPTVVLTFSPHPDSVVAPDRPLRLLTLPSRRAELLASLGVDVVAYLQFTQDVRHMEPRAFIDEVLVGALNASVVAVGEDFRFGDGGSGDVPLLERVGREAGFRLLRVAPVGDGEPISSTRIRRLITAGRVRDAGVLLGRPFDVSGTVVAGVGRGRTIGIPTANLELDPDQLMPESGVYAVQCSIARGEAPIDGVANIGVRPTFGGSSLTLEVHLLDVDRDVYGEELRVSFIERVRDEKKFASPEELVAQIHADIVTSRELLAAAP